jgi:hypothetical protein
MRKNHNSSSLIRSFAKVASLGLVVVATTLGTLTAAEVPVRFVEGVLHGFLVLRTLDGVQLAQGDLFQVNREGDVKSHTVFLFDDGSIYDETAVYTQRRVFTMQSYRLVQRGPVYPADTEFSLERATGKYRVKITDHKDGQEKLLEGTFDLPTDLYNGMILTVVKNLAEGASETVHLVALTPQPRIIQLEMAPADKQKVLVGKLEKTAIHYVLKPQLGMWLKLFATLLGRVPPDEHAWIVTGEVPAFVRVEGPLYLKGPVWRIELTSPRWPG